MSHKLVFIEELALKIGGKQNLFENNVVLNIIVKTTFYAPMKEHIKQNI